MATSNDMKGNNRYTVPVSKMELMREPRRIAVRFPALLIGSIPPATTPHTITNNKHPTGVTTHSAIDWTAPDLKSARKA